MKSQDIRDLIEIAGGRLSEAERTMLGHQLQNISREGLDVLKKVMR